MYQNSLFYLQQGTAYVVGQEENSVFLVNNKLAFTLQPQDLGSKAKANLEYQPVNIEVTQFKNSHYSYPLARQYADSNVKDFFDSHQLLQFNRAHTSARLVWATKGGYLCLICGILGFLPKTHSPRILKHRLSQGVRGKRQDTGMTSLQTLYQFYSLCEQKFHLSIPCRYLSRIYYPPKTRRGKFQFFFSFVYSSFPLHIILRERKKQYFAQLSKDKKVDTFKRKPKKFVKKSVNF